ncbi:MAG: hypothetical protein LBE36_11720 [Flavobacteriaceae bacterium]|jgi:nucleoid DNA-binding protein|nr:hypothetical protein [Flavobacteriaceae bacterium]
MNIPSHILDFLKKNESVFISEFGEFFVQNTAAILNREDKTILPPGKRIFFRINYEIHDFEFVRYVSAKENISEYEAKLEIKKLIYFWKYKLEKEGEVSVPELGHFTVNEESVNFSGNRITTLSSDFYGLEKINFSQIKNKTSIKKTSKNKTGKFILWFFLLIILAALLYFGITKKDRIFTKEFWENISTEISGVIK